MAFIFWFCFIALLYTYAGYPLLLLLIDRLKRPEKPADYYEPTVTMVVPAYNEESLIESKILNCLALDYPREKLEVIVVNDGSTDNTGRIISKYADTGIIVHENKSSIGKIGVINAMVPESQGEVVVFSDASAMLQKDAMACLVNNFCREEVGCVSGRYVYDDSESTTSGNTSGSEGLYWKYESFIKEKESRVGNVIGSHGALYGIRKELFAPLDTRTINDDLALPLMALEKNYKTVYERTSVARECSKSDIENEFHRRVRIMRGNCRQAVDFWRLLNPFRGMVSIQFISHKILRVLSPFFVIGLLVASLLCGSHICRIALWGQGFFYLIALMGALLQKGEMNIRLFSLPYYFVFIQCAALIGTMQFILGGRKIKWNRSHIHSHSNFKRENHQRI